MGFSSSHGNQQSTQSSNSNSASLNQAYPSLNTSLSPTIEQGNSANSSVLNLLGLNGSPAQMTGFDNFRNSGGYNFIKNEGIDGVNSNNAARGLLDSGSAAKGVANYSRKLANTWLDKYLTQLGGVSGRGLQAAQTLSGAGNTANSQSTSVGQSTGTNSSMSLSTG